MSPKCKKLLEKYTGPQSNVFPEREELNVLGKFNYLGNRISTSGGITNAAS